MDIGLPELFVVLVIILLIFGPGRIVNLSRELGKGIREFRQGLGGSQEDREEKPAGSSSPPEASEVRKDY